MTQIGWKYQELVQKYNIVLKLQIYIHIDTNLHKDSEKIGLGKIKIYHTYNSNNIELVVVLKCMQYS